MLMGRRCHGSQLLADDQSSTRDGDEDLAHDDGSDVLVWATEMDHQCDAEDGQRDAEEQSNVLEPARIPDVHSSRDCPETRADTVDVEDVRRLSDRLVVDDLEKGVEVGVP